MEIRGTRTQNMASRYLEHFLCGHNSARAARHAVAARAKAVCLTFNFPQEL